MEYWLFNYPPAGSNNCPSGLVNWVNLGTAASASTTCHGESSVTTVPVQPITSLGSMELWAAANALVADPSSVVRADIVTLCVGATCNSAQAPNVLSLYQGWSSEEFNVVGDWNLTEADFNVGTAITVHAKISPVSFPPGDWLSCTGNGVTGVTGEFNNLNLSPTCITNYGSPDVPEGYVEFTEALPATQFELQGAGSGMCLDVVDGATTEGSKVDIWPCKGTPNQLWSLNSLGELQGVGSGLCLNVIGGATGEGSGLQSGRAKEPRTRFGRWMRRVSSRGRDPTYV